jgi:EmrB/QacA subfamily drug resistance transporter
VTNRQRWTLVAAIIGSGIVFLDGTIVLIALPKIGELPSSVVGVLEGQNYVQSGYLAVLSALLILAGALADFYGRRRIFAIGLAGFGITSFLCGIAPSLELIVLFRVLQGAAGALLVPGSLSIITATFDGAERSKAFGTWAAATSGLAVLGQPIGGLLVDSLSWRAAFLINVPLVAIALWATLRHMQESKDTEASGRFDWLGAIVGAIAIGGLAFGATRGQQLEWRDSLAWGSLAVGAVALVVFPFLMMRRPDPLVPLSLFKIRDFAVINLSTFLIYAALYVTFFYQSVLLQGTLAYSAVGASLAGLPSGLLLTFLSRRVGAVAGRIGARPFLVAGPLIMAAGMAWWARVPSSSVPWQASLADPASLVPPASTLIDVLPAVILFGIGISLVVAPLTSTLMASVPTRNAGLGSAINNAVSRVGTPLLGAVLFIAVSATFYAGLASRVPGLDTSDPTVRAQIAPLNPPKPGVPEEQAVAAREASVDAFRLAAVLSAALLVGGAVTNGLGLRGASGTARASEGADAASGQAAASAAPPSS